jgi:hypothetical protein
MANDERLSYPAAPLSAWAAHSNYTDPGKLNLLLCAAKGIIFMPWLYRIAQMLNYLALAVYLGGLVALGVAAAPAIFKTIEGAGVLATTHLPTSTDPGRQLGGEVFGNVLQRFVPLEIGSLIALTVATALQAVSRVRITRSAVARMILLAVVLGLAGYDYAAVWPNIWQERAAWQQSVQAGQTSAAARHEARFQELHQTSETLAKGKVYALAALLIASVLADGAAAGGKPTGGLANSETVPAAGRGRPAWRISRRT